MYIKHEALINSHLIQQEFIKANTLGFDMPFVRSVIALLNTILHQKNLLPQAMLFATTCNMFKNKQKMRLSILIYIHTCYGTKINIKIYWPLEILTMVHSLTGLFNLLSGDPSATEVQPICVPRLDLCLWLGDGSFFSGMDACLCLCQNP